MIVFSVALTVLDVLVLWLVVSTKGSWVPRAAAVLAALAVNTALIGAALPETDGQATSKAIPDTNQFIACMVEEPKAIYLWLLVDGGPHGYKQPYSSELHQTCEAAKQAAQQGTAVRIARRTRNGEDSHPGQYVPYVLPPSLPPKS